MDWEGRRNGCGMYPWGSRLRASTNHSTCLQNELLNKLSPYLEKVFLFVCACMDACKGGVLCCASVQVRTHIQIKHLPISIHAIWMSVAVCVCVYLSICLPDHVSLCLSLLVSRAFSVSLSLSLSLSFDLSLSLSRSCFCHYTSIAVCMSVLVCLCLSICIVAHLSMCVSVYKARNRAHIYAHTHTPKLAHTHVQFIYYPLQSMM